MPEVPPVTTEPYDPDTESLPESTIRAMARHLRPEWDVAAVERSDHGTDTVCFLTVSTPTGDRRVVLKATTAGFVEPRIARSEPRLLTLVGDRTDILVPTVHGYCDDHPEFPTPFYLMAHVAGENVEGDPHHLGADARERVLCEAGRNLGRLHELGRFDRSGSVGVVDGELAVLDTEDSPAYDDFRRKLLADARETLDSLADGGYFPHLADEPERFADLVSPAREYVEEAIPALPEPPAPRYNHWDYRYGNLLIDPGTGATNAVLDWANLTTADPAFNVVKVESNLLTPESDSEPRTRALREAFRSAYTDARAAWSFDEATRHRMRVYRLVARLQAMACLPLWYESPVERDERAAQHRAFVTDYL